MSTIAVGSTLQIQYLFEYDDILVDPDSFTGEIFLYDSMIPGYPGTPTDTFTPTQVSSGVYEQEWTPGAAGRYKIVLTGSFLDSTPDITYTKYFLIGEVEKILDLDCSYVISMLGVLSPLYVDPEYILQFYPDGDLVEITEIIHRKSLELEGKVGCKNINPLTQLQYDFVVAATLCELSRIYGTSNSGFNGFTGAESFKLGDLEVTRGDNMGSSSAGGYDVGNADNWCELAASLKLQLNSVKDTFRPVVPGSAFDPVIPVRTLKSSDF